MAVQSNDKQLDELLKNVENGKVQLPDFQRSWVWDDLQIRKFIESITLEKDSKGNLELKNLKLRSSFLEEIHKLVDNGMFDVSIPCEKGKEETDVRATILMDKKDLKDYMDRLNDYYEVSYYEMARLDEPKKGYQKKYFTIEETNDEGEKLFKLVELIADDKQFPIQKPNRIIGAIRVKEREPV